MSEKIGEVAGVHVSVFATPTGPRVSVVTSDAKDGARLTWAEAAALSGVIMRAADKVAAIVAEHDANEAARGWPGPKGTP